MTMNQLLLPELPESTAKISGNVKMRQPFLPGFPDGAVRIGESLIILKKTGLSLTLLVERKTFREESVDQYAAT